MSALEQTNPENARVTAGLTFREDGFPSLTYHISISDDQRKGEKISEAVDRVYLYVETKLQEKIDAQRAESS